MTGLPGHVRLVIFDLDGVVYRGDQAVPGAPALIHEVRDAGGAVRFATNNSMATRQAYADRLTAMGVPAVADEVVTSTWATIEHLRRTMPTKLRVLALGAPGMVDEFRAAGYATTPAGEAAPDGYDGGPLPDAHDVVVVGLDPQLDYRRLAVAATAVRSGAHFVATNADLRYPTPAGFLPGAGASVAAVSAASGGVTPLIIGKPEPAMFEAALASAGVAASEAVVVGDNPDADIAGAHRAGIASILVLTGIADRVVADRLSGPLQPDSVAEDPAAVWALLAGRISP